MKSAADSMNAPLVILIAPYQFQLDGDKTKALPQRMLIDFAEKNNIEYIDLLPVFAENSEKELFADGNHFEVEGHKVVAAKLADYLKNKFIEKP